MMGKAMMGIAIMYVPVAQLNTPGEHNQKMSARTLDI
jgi:hypothetical protein